MNTLRRLSACSAALVFLIAPPPTANALDLSITPDNNAIAGHVSTISVTADQISFQPGGFDLLLQFDNNRSAFASARAGSMLTACGWEYFTYRLFGQDSTTAYQAFPATHFLQLTGIASATTGYVPACYTQAGEVELAQLDFLVANDSYASRVECEFIPVRFFWRNCNDNVIWNAAGDTAHVAFELSEYGVPGTLNLAFPGSGAPANDCDTMSTRIASADISALNGGLDVVCADPLYMRGDINLNGIPYEAGDAVLFALFFQYGMSVLPWPLEAAIANSDVNADGLPLSVADYVYLVRVIYFGLMPVAN